MKPEPTPRGLLALFFLGLAGARCLAGHAGHGLAEEAAEELLHFFVQLRRARVRPPAC
jgi:hypothetical protein